MLYVILLYVLAAPIGWYVSGTFGLVTAAVAAGCCLPGAILALFVGDLLQGAAFALQRLLLGMMFRMGIPLALALAIDLAGGRLADTGFLYYLAAFYPFVLGVETVLSIPPTERCGRSDFSQHGVS